MNFAETILQQLGGNKFIAMTGAKSFVKDSKNNKLFFKIGTNPKKVTHVTITLNGKDLYDIEFLKIRGVDINKVAEFKDIDAENLRDVFEKNTGLHVSL